MGIIFIIELPMGHANSIPRNRSLNRQVALSLWGTGTEYVNRLSVVGGFERQLGEQGNTINPHPRE